MSSKDQLKNIVPTALQPTPTLAPNPDLVTFESSSLQTGRKTPDPQSLETRAIPSTRGENASNSIRHKASSRPQFAPSLRGPSKSSAHQLSVPQSSYSLTPMVNSEHGETSPDTLSALPHPPPHSSGGPIPCQEDKTIHQSIKHRLLHAPSEISIPDTTLQSDYRIKFTSNFQQKYEFDAETTEFAAASRLRTSGSNSTIRKSQNWSPLSSDRPPRRQHPLRLQEQYHLHPDPPDLSPTQRQDQSHKSSAFPDLDPRATSEESFAQFKQLETRKRFFSQLGGITFGSTDETSSRVYDSNDGASQVQKELLDTPVVVDRLIRGKRLQHQSSIFNNQVSPRQERKTRSTAPSSISSNCSPDTEQSYRELHEYCEESCEKTDEAGAIASNCASLSNTHDTKANSLRSELQDLIPATVATHARSPRSFELPTASSLLKERSIKPSSAHLPLHNIYHSVWKPSGTLEREPSKLPSSIVALKVPAQNTTVKKAHSYIKAPAIKPSLEQESLKLRSKNKSLLSTTSTKCAGHLSNKPPRMLREAHSRIKAVPTEVVPVLGGALYNMMPVDKGNDAPSGGPAKAALSDGGSHSLSKGWKSLKLKTPVRPTIVAGRVAPFPRQSSLFYSGLGRSSPHFLESNLRSAHGGRVLKHVSNKSGSRSRSTTPVLRDYDWNDSPILPTWGLDPYPPIDRNDNPFSFRSRSSTGSNAKQTFNIPSPSFMTPKLKSGNLAFLDSSIHEDASVSRKTPTNNRKILGDSRDSALAIKDTTSAVKSPVLPSDNFAFLNSPYNTDTVKRVTQKPQILSKSTSKALESPRIRSRLRKDRRSMPESSHNSATNNQDSMDCKLTHLANMESLFTEDTIVIHGLGLLLPQLDDYEDLTDSRTASSLSKHSSVKRLMNRRVLRKDETETSEEDEAPISRSPSSFSRRSSSCSRAVIKVDDSDMEGESSEGEEEEEDWYFDPVCPTSGKLLREDPHVTYFDEKEELPFDEIYDFDDAIEPRQEQELSQETDVLLNRLKNVPVVGGVRQVHQKSENGLQDYIQDYFQEDLQDDIQSTFQLVNYQECFEDDIDDDIEDDTEDDIQDDRLYAQELLGFSTAQMTRMMGHNGPATLDEVLAIARQQDFRERMGLDEPSK